MELDLTGVEKTFAHLSGETPNQEGDTREALCAQLCAQCAGEVQRQVQPGLTPEEETQWEETLEALAAAQAFYQLLLTDEAVTPESLTAGDLRLTGGQGSLKAERLVLEKRRAAAPALKEMDFYFGRIGEWGEDDSEK